MNDKISIMNRLFIGLFGLGCLGISCVGVADPITVLAAESQYGAIARRIGGQYVEVESILRNPRRDPHLFTTSPSTVRAVEEAQVVIYNGLGYDEWMQDMLASSANNNKLAVIKVSALLGSEGRSAANPHIWYKPQTFPLLARQLAEEFKAILHEPQASEVIAHNLDSFLQENKGVQDKVAALKKRYAGTAVTATEPVYNDMAEALGLVMAGKTFQYRIMQGAEPSARQIAHYQQLLYHHQVKVLFYNKQVTRPLIDNMLDIARHQSVGIVGISEIMPAGRNPDKWLLATLRHTADALEATRD